MIRGREKAAEIGDGIIQDFENKSGNEVVGSGAAKVVHDDGSKKSVEIIPLQIGPVDFDVDVLFSDGAMSRKTFQLSVVPSSQGLKKFYINHGSHALAIVLDDDEGDRQAWLSPEVYYEHLDRPIFLTDSKQIKFTVDQPDSDPVIRLDPTGLVHGLRPGTARVVATFDGVEDSVTVIVYSKDDAPAGYR